MNKPNKAILFAIISSTFLMAAESEAKTSPFPAEGIDTTYSLGQFTVDVFNDPGDINWTAAAALASFGFTWDGAGKLTSPLLFDNNTQIHHGTPYAYDTPGDPSTATKVDTEITRFSMTDVSGVALYAGSAAEPGTPPSLGVVTSNVTGGGFDAKSTFDVYVNARLPNGDFLYNPSGQALQIFNSSITSFPPTTVYTHESSTAAPVYFHTPGAFTDTLFGYLVVAGHGVKQAPPNPADNLAEFEAVEIEQEGEDGSLVTVFNNEFASMAPAPLPPPFPLQIHSQFAPVPIPAAFWLFGSGLAGLLTVGYKSRKSA